MKKFKLLKFVPLIAILAVIITFILLFNMQSRINEKAKKDEENNTTNEVIKKIEENN